VTDKRIAGFFGPDGELGRVIAGYEDRPQQQEMAAKVWHTLNSSGRLAVEAGTGVGKSLAYLLPAALWAKETHKRVLVSTYTRLLQSQLIAQDIPLLAKALGEPVKAAVAFGQENYICRFRLEGQLARGLFDTVKEAKAADRLFDWAAGTETGVIIDYPHPLPPGLSQRIGRDSASCRRDRCPHRRNCFYNRAREEWAKSDILVVNHSLLFAAITTESDLLPESGAVVFDEAHRIEDAAVRHFGSQASEHQLATLLDRLSSSHGAGLAQALGKKASVRRALQTDASSTRVEVDQFFRAVDPSIPQETLRTRMRTALDSATVAATVGRLAKTVEEAAPAIDDEILSAEMVGIARRLQQASMALDGFSVPEPEGSVHWAERNSQGRLSLLSAPLDVAPMMRTAVYDNYASVVLTSATMTVARDFGFLSTRLGLDGFETVQLDSPFDYPAQAMLYVANHLPLPSEAAKFNTAAAETIATIIKASRGRALVLFTSYDSMNAVYKLMEPGDYNYLIQGDTSVAKLLEDFRTDTHSVLFATQSFWQGIDVPGESLSCLIICRLPFEVPDDPRLTAIAERIRADGKEPFTEYQLPTAVLRFRQGFGRLIRTAQDRGVVCVLDKRILGKNYGRLFLNSLPKGLPVTTKLDALAAFFHPAK
jgi:ATP-dependent DNA helicase DinG